MSDLAKGQIGPEASYDLRLENGNLIFDLKYQGQDAGAGVSVSISSSSFLDKLEKLIPGQIDDAVIEMLKVVLGRL